MKLPSIMQFFILPSEEGGYTASAVGYSIHTEGNTLDETVKNIQEAVECHFGEETTTSTHVPIIVNFALPVAS